MRLRNWPFEFYLEGIYPQKRSDEFLKVWDNMHTSKLFWMLVVHGKKCSHPEAKVLKAVAGLPWVPKPHPRKWSTKVDLEKGPSF